MEKILPRTARNGDSRGAAVLQSAAGAALVIYGAKRRSVLRGAVSLVGAELVCRGVTGHGLGAYVGIGNMGTRASIPHQIGVQIRRSIIIGVEPEQIYEFLRDARNMPRFIRQIADVKCLDDVRTEWTARFNGIETTWVSRIINEIPNRVIAWRSEGDAAVDNAGSVWFEKAPKDLGTIVRVILQVRPPGGALATLIGKFFGADPERQVGDHLRALKQLLEAGEIATTRGQPAGDPQNRRPARREADVAWQARSREEPRERLNDPLPSTERVASTEATGTMMDEKDVKGGL